MKHRLLQLLAAATVAGCARHGSASPTARPAVTQPLSFVTTRGSDTVTVRYRGVAHVRSNEIEIVLHEGPMPTTGPFTGAFRGFSIALASGEPGWQLREQVASDRVDVTKIHFANETLSDSIVFRIRHVRPDSLAGMWFVLQEWRLWHSDGTPELAPVSAARSTDVFRPGGTVPLGDARP